MFYFAYNYSCNSRLGLLETYAVPKEGGLLRVFGVNGEILSIAALPLKSV
jgi:hypothetical protein